MMVLVALFMVVAFVEIAVIIQVGQWLGVLETIALLVAVSLVGAWLVKQQGLGVLRQVVRDRRAGRVPATALAEGALILLAGVLLLVPGFVTDAVGLVLLVPPVRAGVRGWVRRRWDRRLARSRQDLGGAQEGPSQQESRHPHSGQR